MTYVDTLKEKLKREKYRGVETPAYGADCARLENGEPYEYVLGYVDFINAHIDLSLHPMIPRPETAFWVARAIEELRTKYGDDPIRLADTFAGAGNVGLALLKNLPNATVDLCELDPALKEQVKLNLKLNGIEDRRARVVTAADVQGLAGTYEGIFAVPPYVPYEALPDLDKEMIDYEPHLAFFAHENGHEFHKILIEKARDFLNDGGTLYMEADMDHNDAIREMVKGTAWSLLEFWPDPYGATPNVILRK